MPVIFPQFGEQGAGKRHGIARSQPWRLLSATIEAGAAVARLGLQGRLDVGDGRHGRQAQPGQDGQAAGTAALPAATTFGLVLEVRLQGAAVQLGLTIDNTGSAAWSCQAALHTYLRVDALEQAGIDGLQGCRFIDQTAGGAVSTQADAALVFSAEVDRIYAAAPSPLLLRDGRRRLHVAQQGFADTVVWNPGAVKAAALTDLPAQGYREFVCIESAAIASRLMLEPGASWHAAQHLSVLPADA